MDAIERTDQNNENIEEEQSIASEVEYAGLTQYSLNNLIAQQAIESMLSRRKKQRATMLIQKVYRGYVVRKKIKVMFQSAINIEKIWRGFAERRRYFKSLKQLVMSNIYDHHFKSAQKIQAAFRGYYTRKYVHDQTKLRQLRVESAQELLQCVAIKTRELLKNHQLPGVYSLRNSICLSKVEKLMASLRIRDYNESVRKARADRVLKLSNAFEKSVKSKDQTDIPFGECKDSKKPQNLDAPKTPRYGRKYTAIH